MTENETENGGDGLPAGWARTTLAEVVRPTRPKRTPRDYPELPFVGMEHVEAHSMRLLGTVPADTMSSSAVHFQPNDVLYGRLRPYLNKVHRAEFEGLCSAEFIVFPESPFLNPRLLAYFLNARAFANFASHLDEGDRPRVDFGQIGTSSFSLPPLPEQARIVARIEELLSQVDAGADGLRALQKKLRRYRAAVLKAACEGTLVPTEAELARAEGRAYEPAGELLDRVLAERRARWEADQLSKMRARGAEPKDDKWKAKYEEPAAPDVSGLAELPEGWGWTSLGQAFGVYVGATPSRRASEYWGGDIKWASSGEVAFRRINDTREKITAAGLANTSTEVHPAGTVLLGMIGEGKTRGQVAILGVPACNNQNCAAIRVSEANIPPEYVYRYLEGKYDETRRRGSGNNQPALNKTSVSFMQFPLPPLAEIERIVAEVESRLSVLDQMEAALRDNLKRADRLRQAVLRDAFAGKLVPQDPGDEPAAVLLERIRAERAAATAAPGRLRYRANDTFIRLIRP